MALSRRERQRIQEIESYLILEEPDLARRLARFEDEFAEAERPEPVSRGVVVAVCGVIAMVALLLMVSLASDSGAERSQPPSAPASSTVPENPDDERGAHEYPNRPDLIGK